MSLKSWGNYPKIPNQAWKFHTINELNHIINNNRNLIPYGNGRSYGDSALNENIIHASNYNHFLSFDNITGVLHCQAGVLLSDILEIIIPKGWFLSVTPGTRLITIGGAIASDVHGKNHHVSGSFSDSIIDFSIMLPSGDIIKCSPEVNTDLFKATCGGMGLTGVILDARIKLIPINSAFINQVTIKTKNLEETFHMFDKFSNFTYSVAWIDCLAKKEKQGRCLLTVGEFEVDGNLKYASSFKANIPLNFPSFAMNTLSIKLFNILYYGKTKKGISKQKVDINSFFYPLDTINNWNRIYGNNGFTQYQFVLPLNKSFEGLTKILSKISDSGKGSFLAVLKLFGKGNNNWLSFPFEGYTLALDFKIEPGLFELLNELDEIIISYGGRFYLTKDVRISKRVFEMGYPDIDNFRALREKYKMKEKFNSLQSKRLNI